LLQRRYTSVYTEKTFFTAMKCTTRKKHLRLRGENSSFVWLFTHLLETPPLERRNHLPLRNAIPHQGNTSTYMEKNIIKSLERLRMMETLPLARRKTSMYGI